MSPSQPSSSPSPSQGEGNRGGEGEHHPAFLVDLNVGRLAKWLRVMGYDALFLPGLRDGDLLQLAQAQRRILLTRDTGLICRRVVASGQVRALLVQGDHIMDQLRYVVEKLRLQASHEFSRCIQCNVSLVPLPREAAQERVPPYVYATQREFQQCPECAKLYWRGTHWANMQRELARVRGSTP